MNKTMLKVTGLALVGVLAACSPQSTTGLSQSDAQALNETSQTELALTGSMLSDAGVSAATVQNAQLTELEVNAQAFGLPRRMVHVLAALEAYIPSASNPNCTISQEPATPTDADADGTPATVTMTFNCAGTRPSGSVYETQGVATLQDTDDAAANSGFMLNLQNFHAKVTRDDGSVVDRTVTGSFERDKTTSNWQIEKQYSHNVTVTKGSKTYTGSVNFKVSKTYTPDDASKPWAAGTIVILKGTPADLTWIRNGITRNLIWYTDPSLHWNRGLCASSVRLLNFDSGAKEFVYTNPEGKKSTLRLEFSGCGNITTTLTQDGVASPVN